MARKQSNSTKRRAGGTARSSKRRSPVQLPSRRTQIVWICFVGAMTVVIGMLQLKDGLPRGGFVATNIGTLSADSGTTTNASDRDGLFDVHAPIDGERWTGIVIHHLARPGGDAETIHRLHQDQGMHGMGYHFVIGNGNGMGDGIIQVGYRWDEQLPGAHVAGSAGALHNEHSIGICLIGHGDRRPFTDRQMDQLVRLVQRLQRGLDIPGHRVRLHRELFEDTTSPGRCFPAASFRSRILP